MHPFVQLAKRTVENYVQHSRKPDPPAPLPDDLTARAGAFVSLKKKGDLRGCIGTLGPTKENLAQEIIDMAVAAATRDSRFTPVEPEELGDLSYSVDVLSEPEEISSMDELDPKEYGVIVSAGYRRGLLLPDLEGVDTPEQQVAIAARKGGIRPDEPYRLQRFKVTRYR